MAIFWDRMKNGDNIGYTKNRACGGVTQLRFYVISRFELKLSEIARYKINPKCKFL